MGRRGGGVGLRVCWLWLRALMGAVASLLCSLRLKRGVCAASHDVIDAAADAGLDLACLSQKDNGWSCGSPEWKAA